MQIIKTGNSLAKLVVIAKNELFAEVFTIERPIVEEDARFTTLLNLCNQLISIKCLQKESISLRGQFQHLQPSNNILFIGSPWFASVEEIQKNNLKLNDFAVQDPVIDLLHLLKTQEIVTDEVKMLLTTINKQKSDLKRLSFIAEETVNGVVITDASGRIEWVNRGFEKITGYTLKEIQQKTPGSFLQGNNSSAETINYLKQQISNKQPFVCEIINYKKNGQQYWVRINGQPLFDNKNNISGFFAIEEDITQEKENELKIQHYEERFRIALEKIGDNVWIHDFESNTTEFSKNDTDFLGFNLSETKIHPQVWWNCVHPEDKWMLEENNAAYLAGKIDHHSLEYRIIHETGQVKWVLDRGIVFEKKNNLPHRIIGTHTDITKLKEAEETINTQKQFYETILNNIPSDIAVFDSTHTYLFVNPKGIKDETLRKWIIGKKDEDYIKFRNKPLYLLEGRKKLFAEVLKTKKIKSWEEEIIKPDGSREYILRNMYPYLNEKGKVELVIGYGVDITERIKIEQQLKIAQQETQAAALAKERFLANMSHEIRTPMNGILGITGFLAKTDLNPKQKEYIHLIRESTSNLLVILNDVLDLEKIIAGKLELEKTSFNITEKIKLSTESFRYKSEEKELFLEYDNLLPENLFVVGDPHRLSQILLNLISNAVKFTEKGSIIIGTKISKETDTEVEIEFSVADSGIGIAKDKLQKIFDPYVQAKSDISRKYGGTGLGLSICKHLVEIQKGKIEVTSKETQGSIFKFTIPYQKSKHFTVQTIHQYNYACMKDKKILVAEDVEVNQYVMKSTLEAWGCSTTIVDNGKKAVEAVRNNDFDLILMDIQMPEMNGFEATEIIRNLPDKRKAALPIIAVTANSLKGITERYISSGMDDYILKPLEESKLFLVMEKHLIVKNNPQKTTDNTPIYDSSQLTKMGGGNETFIKKLAEIFVRTAPLTFDLMMQALTTKNWQEVSREAHKLKSSIDSMGITPGKEIIRKIEDRCKAEKDLDTIEALSNEFKTILQTSIEQLKKDFLN